MRLFSTLLSVLVIGLLPTMSYASSEPAPLSDAEKTQIENVIRDFLVNKEPETLMKAAQKMQEKQEAENLAKGKTAVAKSHDKLFNDVKAPFGGNPKADVTIVEFFDYQCGYCKMAEETVVKLLAEDKNVKVVYKEFPILGAQSMTAAKAALASMNQGKYQKFHEALMVKKDHFTAEIIDQIAKEVGLNVEKLHKDMADESIEKTITANLALGGEIGARGTPMFIIGDKLIPGAVSLDVLKAGINDIRSAKK